MMDMEELTTLSYESHADVADSVEFELSMLHIPVSWSSSKQSRFY